MTEKTNYTLSNGDDLSDIFSSIVVNQVDRGTLLSTAQLVGEGWTVLSPTKSGNSTNITIVSNQGSMGFQINNAGLYRLNISLYFSGNSREQGQSVVFILNSVNTTPPGDNGGGYEFTPLPPLSDIYAINCSGASGNNNATNSLNKNNLGNCFTLNQANTNIESNPYFFSFKLEKSSSGTSLTYSNFFTLDMTFQITAGKIIYPQIRCRREDGPDPYVYLDPQSKWMFTKINDI